LGAGERVVLQDAFAHSVNAVLCEVHAPALSDFPVHFKTAPVEERTMAIVTLPLLVPLAVLLT
jgi:hypothetical protein